MIYYYLDFTNLNIVNESQYGLIFNTNNEMEEYFRTENIQCKKECILKFNLNIQNFIAFIFTQNDCVAKILTHHEIVFFENNCVRQNLRDGYLFINDKFTVFLYLK